MASDGVAEHLRESGFVMGCVGHRARMGTGTAARPEDRRAFRRFAVALGVVAGFVALLFVILMLSAGDGRAQTLPAPADPVVGPLGSVVDVAGGMLEPVTAPVLDAAPAPAPASPTPPSAVALPAAPVPPLPVAPALAGVEAVAAPVAQTVGARNGGALNRGALAASVTGPVTGALDPTLGPVPDTLDPTLGPVPDTLNPIVALPGVGAPLPPSRARPAPLDATVPYPVPGTPPVQAPPLPFGSPARGSTSSSSPFSEQSGNGLLLLFAIATTLTALTDPRVRRVLLFGAVKPRFTYVSLIERPG